MTAFDEAWTILKATVQEMRDYQPTGEQLARLRAFPIVNDGYVITPEDKEKYKEELAEFEEDLANLTTRDNDLDLKTSRYHSPGDYHPPETVYDNLSINYGTPRQGPLEEDGAGHQRLMRQILAQMASSGE